LADRPSFADIFVTGLSGLTEPGMLCRCRSGLFNSRFVGLGMSHIFRHTTAKDPLLAYFIRQVS